jgi:hypothetical protein
VKIYAAAVEALRKKERQDETQFTTKIGAFMANVLFCRFSFNLTRFETKPRVLVLCFPNFTENSIVTHFKFVVGTPKVQLLLFCDGHL